MESAGKFLRLLSKPKLASKPKGDQDPIPEEWTMGDDAEDAEEEAWRASTAAMQTDKPGYEVASASAGDEQPEAEEYQEEEEEELHDDTSEPAEGDDDGQDDAEPQDEDDAEAQDGADDDGPPKDDDDTTDVKEQSRREYEEMDTQMGELKKFVVDEHGKKRKHDDGGNDDGADEGHWQSNKYRNKGKGGGNYGYGNKWNYKGKNHGKGRKGWQHGKSKGKGKWHWPKWNYNWEDWGQQQRNDHHDQDGMVLQASKKGGWYLPKGQGYLDSDGNYHAHLGLHQCIKMGWIIPCFATCAEYKG